MKLLVAAATLTLLASCSDDFEERERDIHREIAKQQVGSSPDWIIVKNYNINDKVGSIFGTLDDRGTCIQIIDMLNKDSVIGSFQCVMVEESWLLGKIAPSLFSTDKSVNVIEAGTTAYRTAADAAESAIKRADEAASLAADAAALAADNAVQVQESRYGGVPVEQRPWEQYSTESAAEAAAIAADEAAQAATAAADAPTTE